MCFRISVQVFVFIYAKIFPTHTKSWGKTVHHENGILIKLVELHLKSFHQLVGTPTNLDWQFKDDAGKLRLAKLVWMKMISLGQKYLAITDAHIDRECTEHEEWNLFPMLWIPFNSFNKNLSLSLPLKCCLPHWRRWGHLWLPARCQIPAASADGRGGASCRPALTQQTAGPEPPPDRERRELRSQHDTELVHLPAHLLRGRVVRNQRVEKRDKLDSDVSYLL